MRLGLESYSLNPLTHSGLQDRWIALMKQLALSECNMFEPLIQPEGLASKLRAARDANDKEATAAANRAINEWRASVSLSYFRSVKDKFSASGIRFSIYTVAGITNTSTDAELKRACEIAQALGVERISLSNGRSIIKRFIPLLPEYNLRLNIQGHPLATPPDKDAIATPADYEEAVGYSSLCSIDIDAGDFTGAGYDIMPFLARNHARIDRIELKDRKRDNTSMPWGKGDTPLTDVLLYVRNNHLPIRCYIDCDYAPANEERVASILACQSYMRSVLQS